MDFRNTFSSVYTNEVLYNVFYNEHEVRRFCKTRVGTLDTGSSHVQSRNDETSVTHKINLKHRVFFF